MGFMQGGRRVAPSSAPANKVRERFDGVEAGGSVTVKSTMTMHEEAAKLQLRHPIEAAEQLWGSGARFLLIG